MAYSTYKIPQKCIKCKIKHARFTKIIQKSRQAKSLVCFFHAFGFFCILYLALVSQGDAVGIRRYSASAED